MNKKIAIVFMILPAVLSLFGCDYHKLNHNISLPKYISDECYWGKGFRDNTDFCKYLYDDDSIIKFEKHAKFEKVTDSDIENIKSYFEDFGERVKDEKYYDKYDFDFQSQIKPRRLISFRKLRCLLRRYVKVHSILYSFKHIIVYGNLEFLRWKLRITTPYEQQRLMDI